MKQSIIIVLLFLSCSNAQKKEITKTAPAKKTFEIKNESSNIYSIDSTKIKLNFTPKSNYTTTQNNINAIRKKWNTKYALAQTSIDKHTIIDSAMVFFTNKLLNEIIPHWYGTEWDFEGHTSTPNLGTIACGYFVSTTLLHMGININRYKLAQQNPKNEALSLTIDKSNLIHVDNGNIIYSKLHSMNDGLYFVGLDSHVGYLYINNHNSYFIHSNYIDGKVMVEHTRESEAFISKEYYITPITHNRELGQDWLTGNKIKVVKE